MLHWAERKEQFWKEDSTLFRKVVKEAIRQCQEVKGGNMVMGRR